ncbi:MAG: hypothetical protein K6B40_07490 [Firmicutes bacterium]|nr:hypothetical protein [Bacillota bacterium]
MKKQTILIIIVAVLIFTLTTSVLAAAPEGKILEPKSSNYLRSYNVIVSAEGDNKVKVGFNILATDIMNHVGVLEIKIEKKISGSWVHDRTLSHQYYSNFLRKNVAQNNANVIFNGVPGVQYRATITAYAANSSGSDTKFKTSYTATCY